MLRVESCRHHLGRYKELIQKARGCLAGYPEYYTFDYSLRALIREVDVVVEEIDREIRTLLDALKHARRGDTGFGTLETGVMVIRSDFTNATISWDEEDIVMGSGD